MADENTELLEDIHETMQEMVRLLGGVAGNRFQSNSTEGLDKLNQKTNSAAKTMQDYAVDVNEARAARRQLTLEEREAAKRKREAADAEEKLRNQIDRYLLQNAKALVSFGASLAKSPGDLNILGSAISGTTRAISGMAAKANPLVKALAGLGEVAGQVAAFMIEQLQEAYGKFRELSDVGVAKTFEDMREATFYTGLTLNDLTAVFAKTSKVLAGIGGSAVLGRERIQQLAYSSAEARREFLKLGVTQADFMEFQIGFIEMQRRAGTLKGKTDSQLIEQTKEYIKELDLSAKLTGLNRKEIAKEREARTTDARYRAGIMTLGTKAQKGLNAAFDLMQSESADAARIFMKFAAAGQVVDEETGNMAAQFSHAGVDLTDLIQRMRRGEAGVVEFQEALQKAGPALEAAFGGEGGLATFRGAETAMTSLIVAITNLGKRTFLTAAQQERLRKDTEQTMALNKGQNANMANATAAIYEASRKITELAISSTMVTKSLDYMAGGIEWVTEKLYDVMGGKAPAHIEARKRERSLIEQENAARQKTIAAQKKVDDITNAPAEIKKAQDRRSELNTIIDGLEKKLKSATTDVEKDEIRSQLKEATDERLGLAGRIRFLSRITPEIADTARRELADAQRNEARITRERVAAADVTARTERAAGFAPKPGSVESGEELTPAQRVIAADYDRQIREQESKLKDVNEKEEVATERLRLVRGQLDDRKKLLQEQKKTAEEIENDTEIKRLQDEADRTHERLQKAQKDKTDLEAEIQRLRSQRKVRVYDAGPRGQQAARETAAAPPAAGQSAATGKPLPPVDLSGQLQKETLVELKGAGFSPKEQANIMAQVQAESQFMPRSENMNYSAERLMELFGEGNKRGNTPRFKTLQEAQEVVAQGQEAIGDRLYGGRMGNAANEGYRYRGRGLIQITGKDNYAKFGKLIGVDLVNDPDKANDPEIAKKILVAFIKELRDKGTDVSDIDKLSKAIRHATGSSGDIDRRQIAQMIFEQLPKAAFGGSFKGSMEGFLALLHGEEAVVPLNNNLKQMPLDLNEVVKQIIQKSNSNAASSKIVEDVLRTVPDIRSMFQNNNVSEDPTKSNTANVDKVIPVTITNVSEQLSELKAGFAMMSSKYDTIIDLLGNSNKYQRQTARNTG